MCATAYVCHVIEGMIGNVAVRSIPSLEGGNQTASKWYDEPH